MQTPLQKVVARRDDLADVGCGCCFFSFRGNRQELGFWNDVLEHFQRLEDKTKNQIKDSILYILDENSPPTDKFSTATKNLIKEVSGRDVTRRSGERTLLLNDSRDKKEYWVDKGF